MSSIVSELAGIGRSAGGEALAFGLGFALGRALEPAGVELAQEAWKVAPVRALDARDAAAIAAEDVRQKDWAAGEAAQSGIDSDRFDALLGEVLEAPAFAELVRMLRRGTITPDDLTHGLRKAKIETRWDAPLTELQTERLSAQELATMVQRSVVPNPGVLPVTFDNAGSNVTPMPVAEIDTLKEAAAGGYDKERFAALARIVGLPPAPGELLQLLNRGTINQAAFRQGIAEGNTRNEWADTLMTLRRHLLTPHEYAELALRGWIDTPAMHAGAALSGLESADADLLFKMLGRPLVVHQVTTGLARGGSYGGDYEGVPEPFQTALRQSNVRPEWGNLAYANRYTLPSAFVLRTLAQAGELTHDETHTLLLQIGWPPELAAKVAALWAGGTTTAANKHVAKAQTQLWGTLHRSYLAGETDETVAGENLTALGVVSSSHKDVLTLWDRERELVRKQLTPAQIKKAYKETTFTEAEALQRLTNMGYSAADATTFLGE